MEDHLVREVHTHTHTTHTLQASYLSYEGGGAALPGREVECSWTRCEDDVVVVVLCGQ